MISIPGPNTNCDYQVEAAKPIDKGEHGMVDERESLSEMDELVTPSQKPRMVYRKNKKPLRRITFIKIAFLSACDPRTVEKYMTGSFVCGEAPFRIERVLLAAGVTKDSSADEINYEVGRLSDKARMAVGL